MGKPVFLYVIEELFKVRQCKSVYVVMNSDEIRKLCSKLCYEIKIVDIIPTEYPIFLLSGRAVFLTSATIVIISRSSTTQFTTSAPVVDNFSTISANR